MISSTSIWILLRNFKTSSHNLKSSRKHCFIYLPKLGKVSVYLYFLKKRQVKREYGQLACIAALLPIAHVSKPRFHHISRVNLLLPRLTEKSQTSLCSTRDAMTNIQPEKTTSGFKSGGRSFVLNSGYKKCCLKKKDLRTNQNFFKFYYIVQVFSVLYQTIVLQSRPTQLPQ